MCYTVNNCISCLFLFGNDLCKVDCSVPLILEHSQKKSSTGKEHRYEKLSMKGKAKSIQNIQKKKRCQLTSINPPRRKEKDTKKQRDATGNLTRDGDIESKHSFSMLQLSYWCPCLHSRFSGLLQMPRMEGSTPSQPYRLNSHCTDQRCCLDLHCLSGPGDRSVKS